MNTIASLTRSNPARAESAIEDLSDLFRARIADARATVSLRDEIALAKRYLSIEALRLGERLRIDWSIDDIDQSVMVPSLVLQPLLENAIYHGIEPLPEGGEILVQGAHDEAQVELSISNPLSERTSPHHAGNRIAQDNVRERLNAYFGDRGGLVVEQSEDGYTVRLTIPRVSSA